MEKNILDNKMNKYRYAEKVFAICKRDTREFQKGNLYRIEKEKINLYLQNGILELV